MSENYKVEGELVIRAQAGIRSVNAMAGRLEALRSSLAGSQGVAGGLVRSLMSMGAAYVGINALVGGMRSLVGGAVQYQQGLEGTRIGLAAVMSAVEHIPFAQAQQESQAMFESIQTDALRSVATSRELFDIFQSIYGPLRSSGLAMDEIRGVMLDTVSAASALNVDLPQASRDIQMMARGAAGMHVRLFSMLRATGAIAEDAETFNHLSQPERIAVMQRALGSFSSAADAYGHSFSGVTSTFTDIVENLTGALFGPAFSRLTTWLSSLNDRLLANRDSLRRTLSEAGEVLAGSLGRMLSSLDSGIEYLGNNWRTMMEYGRETVRRLQAVVPDIIRAGQAFLAFNAARAILSVSLGGVAAALNALTMLAGAGAALLPAGAAAAGAGAAGAGAAGAGAAGGGAAGTGGLAAALAGLGPALAVLAAVLAAVGAAAQVVHDRWDAFVDIFGFLEPVLGTIYKDFSDIAGSLWDVVRPALTLIGTILTAILVPAFTAVVGAVRLIVTGIRGFMSMAAEVAGLLEDYLINPLRDLVLELGQYVANFLRMFTNAGDAYHRVSTVAEDPLHELEEAYEASRTGMRFGVFEVPPSVASGTPSDRANVVNDFRGSRITVNQEFRQNDPDRVLMYMIEDINRQAESRITSNFVPALTRY